MKDTKNIDINNLDEYVKVISEAKPITINGKEYTIHIFPTSAMILYNRYIELSQKIISDYKKTIAILGEIEGFRKQGNDKAVLSEEKKINKITKEATNNEDIRKPMMLCLKTVLEANGYKYKEDDWLSKCDDMKLLMFLHLASNKGITSKKKANSVDEMLPGK